MVGYVLRNTLTKNGTVSRGVSTPDENGMLRSIVETTKIRVKGNDAEYLDDNGNWVDLSGDSLVSMNCWGLTPDIFTPMQKKFEEFLAKDHPDPLKSECYLPLVLNDIKNDGDCTIKIYSTDAIWYGVTYAEDKPYVKESIQALMNNVEYPHSLWTK